MDRVFSGIQPTGDIHIGNYVGAIRQWVSLVEEYECIYCVVDYHAITVEYDTGHDDGTDLDTALILIACGLDPEKCHLDGPVPCPEHTELGWVFNCVTPMGEMERMTQFKDKSKQHKGTSTWASWITPCCRPPISLFTRPGLCPWAKIRCSTSSCPGRSPGNSTPGSARSSPNPGDFVVRAPDPGHGRQEQDVEDAQELHRHPGRRKQRMGKAEDRRHRCGQGETDRPGQPGNLQHLHDASRLLPGTCRQESWTRVAGPPL